jgi:hypothetical protein
MFPLTPRQVTDVPFVKRRDEISINTEGRESYEGSISGVFFSVQSNMLTFKSPCIFWLLSAQYLAGKILSLLVRVEWGSPGVTSGIFAAPLDECVPYVVMPSDNPLGDVRNRIGPGTGDLYDVIAAM